jgi:NAD+ kinase
MTNKVALFGGSFNPSAVHHRAVVEALVPHFDKIIVIPCGPRPDKEQTNDIEPVHRAVMADLTFRGIPKVHVDLFDLEHATFTKTHKLDELYGLREGGEIWHVVGTDLVAGGKDGQSPIQRQWEEGAALWHRCRFVVIARDGYPYDPADLPPKSMVIAGPRGGSSTDIRERAFRRQPYADLVVPEVAAYVERYNLYRGAAPARTTRLRLSDPRPFVFADDRNPNAKAIAERLAGIATTEDAANCIVAVGGDGTMLRAIRKHWRRRLPFVGLNAGHRGYLLNEIGEEMQDPHFLFDDLRVHQLPQLYVECQEMRGDRFGFYAFNDAWVACGTGQCAWLEVKVDGQARIKKLVADGALVSTAAGSTGYARSMGATPLLVDSQGWLVVGNNVLEPRFWKSAPLSFDSTVEIESLDLAKRPIRAFIDGQDRGVVCGMRVRPSRVASVELAFAPHRDMAAKLAEDLFP